MNIPKFRKLLLAWYDSHRRDLPWRRTSDPWAVLVSEIMLQQTRVEAVIPYYQRFLDSLPTAAAMAAAKPEQVLTLWAGLGYYSRARNLQNAARAIVEQGGFPSTYDTIRKLPGVGPYTAAAVSSIAFNLPHAALDGNVARVLARLTLNPGDIKSPATRAQLQSVAGGLLHPTRSGDFNQAVMELGAVICTPRDPKCLLCPVRTLCEARAQGRERELPIRSNQGAKTHVEKTIYLIVRRGKILLRRRPDSSVRLSGFWELPEDGTIAHVDPGAELGRFRHAIVNTQFSYTVRSANLKSRASGCRWWPLDRLHEIPLSTTAKKAVPCLAFIGHTQ